MGESIDWGGTSQIKSGGGYIRLTTHNKTFPSNEDKKALMRKPSKTTTPKEEEEEALILPNGPPIPIKTKVARLPRIKVITTTSLMLLPPCCKMIQDKTPRTITTGNWHRPFSSLILFPVK